MASLILTNEVPTSGNGLGAVVTVLTVQSPDNSTFEAGCVSSTGIETGCPAASTSFGQLSFTLGQTQTGTSQTSLRSISYVNTQLPTPITDASQLRFVFNASQPSGSSITLDEMNILFYSLVGSTYTLLDNATFIGPHTLTNTLTGTGNAGWIFTLSADEQALINSSLQAGTLVMGASLNAGCGAAGQPPCGAAGFPANGGHDVIQITEGPGTARVPEPATFMMMGGGVLAAILRKRIWS